jgi:(aminoalkyl)phosphonate N-acetyltransferase
MPTSAALLRRATAQDTAAIRQLLGELEEQTYPADIFNDFFAKNLAREGVYYWLVEVGGQTVGFVSLHVQYLLHHLGPVAEIQELVITAAHQGTGLGQLLVGEARAQARALGCVNLEVTCNQKRQAAHRFYQANGLQPTHLKFVEAL